MTPRTSTYLRRLALAAAGVAIAAGAMMLTAPAGNAIPESQIQRECDDAKGEYTQVIVDGKSYSRCCYRGLDGVKYCDHYVDGTYTNTYHTLEPSQPSPPPPPPGGEVVGPPAAAATPAPQPVMPEVEATLWLPPPAGPAAPPAGEAAPAR
jgi:hypothetical protein